MDISKAASIHGWMSKIELKWLAEIAARSKVIVEFGCYYGRSTRILADYCPGTVYAVDPWNGEYFDSNNEPTEIIEKDAYNHFLNNLSEHIDTGKVNIYKCKSDEFPENIRADMIFIDGDHRYEWVKSDIEKAQRIINKGGIIAGHDYTHKDWPGVKQAVSNIFGDDIAVVDSIWYKKFC